MTWGHFCHCRFHKPFGKRRKSSKMQILWRSSKSAGGGGIGFKDGGARFRRGQRKSRPVRASHRQTAVGCCRCRISVFVSRIALCPQSRNRAHYQPGKKSGNVNHLAEVCKDTDTTQKTATNPQYQHCPVKAKPGAGVEHVSRPDVTQKSAHHS